MCLMEVTEGKPLGEGYSDRRYNNIIAIYLATS